MKLSLQLGVGDQPLLFLVLLLLLLSLLSVKTTVMTTFVVIHFHLRVGSNHQAIMMQSSKEQQEEIRSPPQ